MTLTAAHLTALAALAAGEEIDPAMLEELRAWGLVMPHSLELTGIPRRSGRRVARIGDPSHVWMI